jgi:hypothetical protein
MPQLLATIAQLGIVLLNRRIGMLILNNLYVVPTSLRHLDEALGGVVGVTVR